ncbi:MAG TPA: hypothetical protein PK622_07420 [Saprospiraceae bacterium]|nr:hypothetical protein [Saprospiraceae bacterium]
MHKRHYKCLLIAIYFFCQFSFAQSWKSLNGPIGANVVTSVITKEKAEIFCLSKTDKLLISKDKGKTWMEHSNGIQATNSSISNKKIKESPNGEIYLSTNVKLYKFNQSNEIWEIKFESSSGILDFGFSPDGNSIYLAETQKFYIAKNGGTFIPITSWWTHSAEFLCLGNNNNFVRRTLGASGEIWKFNDDGTQLREILVTRCCQNLFFHKKSSTLFDLGTPDYKCSNDFGETWNTKYYSTNLRITNFVELNDGKILTEYLGKFYISRDNGLNWEASTTYLNSIQNTTIISGTNQISISNDGTLLVNTYSEALLYEPNGSSNHLILPLKELTSLNANILKNGDCYTNTFRGIQFSIDSGNTWSHIDSKFGNKYAAWSDGTIVISELYSDSIYFTSDRFQTVVKKSLPGKNSVFELLQDNRENLIVLTLDSIFMSQDKGDNWNTVGTIDHAVYYDIQISKQNILYSQEVDEKIYYSLDFGLHWNSFQTKAALSHTKAYLTANNVFYWLEIDPSLPNYVVGYTNDFGQSLFGFKLQNGEQLLFIDNYDNMYTFNSQENKIKVFNIFTNKEYFISLDGMDFLTNDNISLYQGKNDYLYAHKQYSKLYQYSNKIEPKLANFNCSIFIDQNDDCTINNTEYFTKNIQLELVGQNNYYSFSPFTNGYFAYLNKDIYEVKIKDPKGIWNLCNFPKQLQVLPDQKISLDSLVITPKIKCVDLVTGLSLSRLRRCFGDNQAFVSIRNDGTTEAIDTKIDVLLDDYFIDISCNTTPISKVGNLWTFLIPKIKVEEVYQIIFSFKVSCDAALEQEHCIKGILEHQNDCVLPLQLSDTLILCEENLGSFDPNDKMVYINGIQSTTFHKTDSVLEYLIRFQNTGTDTAFTVVIKDQLDYNLDWSSLTPISASHDYSYFLNDDGTMEIKFANILLPDSSINYIASNGYFKYNIKPKKDIKIGISIYNKASIYFDFNEPVLTNLTQIQLVPILGTKEIKSQETVQLTAIPNPFSQSCIIVLPDHWKNKNLQYHIASSEGKHHSSHYTNARDITIQRDELKAGIYFVYLIDDRGNRAYCKVVVQ